MICNLQLKNFKCFGQLDIDLKNVTVFTGVNGMGKSTVIQSLLLLAQSRLRAQDKRGLYLNGTYVELGNAQDVVFDKAIDEEIEITYTTSDGNHSVNRFGYEQDADFLPCLSGDESSQPFVENVLVYLSAYRIKPQARYGVINEKELQGRDFGNNGEYTLQYLSVYGDAGIKNPHVAEEDERGTSLMNQTRLWMDRISPGVSPQICRRGARN